MTALVTSQFVRFYLFEHVPSVNGRFALPQGLFEGLPHFLLDKREGMPHINDAIEGHAQKQPS